MYNGQFIYERITIIERRLGIIIPDMTTNRVTGPHWIIGFSWEDISVQLYKSTFAGQLRNLWRRIVKRIKALIGI